MNYGPETRLSLIAHFRIDDQHCCADQINDLRRRLPHEFRDGLQRRAALDQPDGLPLIVLERVPAFRPVKARQIGRRRAYRRSRETTLLAVVLGCSAIARRPFVSVSPVIARETSRRVGIGEGRERRSVFGVPSLRRFGEVDVRLSDLISGREVVAGLALPGQRDGDPDVPRWVRKLC